MKGKISVIILAILLLLLGIFFYWRFFSDDSVLSVKISNSSLDNVVKCALSLYNQKKSEGVVFSSQCLGSCGNYAVDIVHVPRTIEDNLPENQCEEFRNGKLSHFIELDKEGNIVRIV